MQKRGIFVVGRACIEESYDNPWKERWQRREQAHNHHMLSP
jgi:hypothetical protein